MKESKKLQILVIEDNMGDFLLIKDYLEEQMLMPEVIHAKKYNEAIPLLSNHDISFDVILLDLTLPDKTGEELIREVIAFRPDVPVIILTGYADLDFSVRSLSLKVSDYLLKDDINSTSLYKSIMYNIERKKTNLQLEESEKRYSNLFQLSPQPMWIMDIQNFQFVQVNHAALAHYGYHEDEFLRLTIKDLINEELSPEELMQKLNWVINSNKIYKGRFQHLKKSGEQIEVDIYSTLITINDRQYESAIAIDVTEKIRMEHRITKAIIKTQEDERFEIGTELHDNVCQILASSLLSLDMLKDKLPPESIQWHLKSKQFINLALEEIRNISHRLAPSFFDYTTIEDTFKELVDNFNIEKKLEVSFNFDLSSVIEKLNSDLQLNLYRILQEQLRNISKYAQAQHIKVDISADQQNLVLCIHDDGVGFDYDLVKKGIGLANIKRRAELFGGIMEIESSPGKGCLLCVTIPL